MSRKRTGAERIATGATLTLLWPLTLGCSEDTPRPKLAGVGGESSVPVGAINTASSSLSDECEKLENPRYCDTASAFLEQIRPELFFILDTSGSMNTDVTSRSTRLETTVEAVLESLAAIHTRVDVGVIEFPGTVVANLTEGDPPSAVCSGDTPRLDYLTDQLEDLTAGGETPLGDALKTAWEVWAASDQSAESDATAPRYAVVLTDGLPNQGGLCPNDSGDFVSCDPTSYAVYWTEQLAELHVSTYAVGLPGFPDAEDTLVRIAEAGETSELSLAGFFDASDPELLVEALTAISKETFDCTLRLSEPLETDLVNVYVDGDLVPRDESDGWALVDARTLEIVGSACDDARASEFGYVVVEAGCTSVLR